MLQVIANRHLVCQLARRAVLLALLAGTSASLASAAQFTLTWSDNSTNENGFRVERSPNGTAYTEIATTAANITSYVDAGLPNSTTYWYRLRAFNTAGVSGYSNVATGTTPPASVNAAPTISDITNQVINAGASTAALSFSVADVETAAGGLTVAGSSSNTTLVPGANIVFGGSGSSRTVTVTPASGQTGTATITVTVSDGSLAATDTFAVTVNGTNSAPTITEIANRTINEDASTGSIAFTVGDAQSAATSLTLTRSSSNTALVPTTNVVLGGSGSARTVTITPAANQSGLSTISIAVSDGVLTTTESFIVTVNAVNDAPSIGSIADCTITQDATTGPITFTVGDVETATGSLVVTGSSSNTTLVPQTSIVLGGSAASRTVALIPAAGQTGTATISISVSDGALSSSTSFSVTVSPSGGLVVTETSGFVNTALPAVQNGPFTFEFDALPSASAMDAVVGLSPLPATGYANLAAIVRFSSSGIIDARNGAAYSSAQSIPYTGGRSYHVRFVVDVTTHTYSAFVTPAGGSEIVLGSNYAFRTEQASASSLGNWSARVTGTGSLTISSVSLSNPVINTAPTISPIANATINEDTSTAALPFTVGDGQTAATSLVLSASSSNATLVPAANISFGGSGSSRTVTVRPTANLSGTATITVRVSDGSLSTNRTFSVSVSAVNDTPTISNILDRTVENGMPSGAIAFTIGDVETSVGSLIVSATSSNQALLADASLIVGGTGSNRTLSFTPQAGQSGTATISVRVSDGSRSATDTFVVTVPALPVVTNTAPTISAIAAQSIAMNSTSAPIPFTISDAETPSANLTLTTNSSDQALVPLGNITISGTGASRTVTIRPVSNTTGWSTIWIKVSDGVLSQTISFVVNVSVELTYGDIGSPAIAGSHTASGSTIQIRAGGTDIWNRADQFHFARTSLAGDAELTVHVTALTRSNSWAKAGLMFRTSTASNSAYVFVFLTPSNGLALDCRRSSGARAVREYSEACTAPEWLKLTRSGDTFYAFRSNDGISWDLLDYVIVDLPDSVSAGLAVTSRSTTTATTATFDSLSVD